MTRREVTLGLLYGTAWAITLGVAAWIGAGR